MTYTLFSQWMSKSARASGSNQQMCLRTSSLAVVTQNPQTVQFHLPGTFWQPGDYQLLNEKMERDVAFFTTVSCTFVVEWLYFRQQTALFQEKPQRWFEMLGARCSQKWPVFKETVAFLAKIQLAWELVLSSFQNTLWKNFVWEKSSFQSLTSRERQTIKIILKKQQQQSLHCSYIVEH